MPNYSFCVFTLFYLLVCVCFVFRTNEFVSAGITIESLLGSYLGSEFDDFIVFHVRRTSLTLLFHCVLPLAVVAVMVRRWFGNNYENHPVIKKLKVFCDQNTSWRMLASDINNEIKRVDKINLQCSTVTRVIATDNWIIKLTPYKIFIAYQSDATLILCSADTHDVSSLGTGTVQYLNIEVKTTRNGAENFNIRCNALDYKDLEEKIRRPITVLQDVRFHRSRIDIFLEVFRGVVEQNPPFVATQAPEMCIGCMVAQSNVKLMKNCGDTTATDRSCTTCYCRPMWCRDCMGKWWVSRQEQDHPETWLSSKCTCPVCRSVFCVLDVCPVQLQNS
ncbi:transmembrane protein 129 isoform X2 [Lycorma delicatula]|uniref:transmembrane protein 129 isoform X2 n=1 Tax=Lycorma delicatula TaxID=130591 RepID=UPI003F5190EC